MGERLHTNSLCTDDGLDDSDSDDSDSDDDLDDSGALLHFVTFEGSASHNPSSPIDAGSE